MSCYDGLIHSAALNMHSDTTQVGKLNTIISQPPLQLGSNQSDALTWVFYSEPSYMGREAGHEVSIFASRKHGRGVVVLELAFTAS